MGLGGGGGGGQQCYYSQSQRVSLERNRMNSRDLTRSREAK